MRVIMEKSDQDGGGAMFLKNNWKKCTQHFEDCASAQAELLEKYQSKMLGVLLYYHYNCASTHLRCHMPWLTLVFTQIANPARHQLGTIPAW